MSTDRVRHGPANPIDPAPFYTIFFCKPIYNNILKDLNQGVTTGKTILYSSNLFGMTKRYRQYRTIEGVNLAYCSCTDALNNAGNAAP